MLSKTLSRANTKSKVSGKNLPSSPFSFWIASWMVQNFLHAYALLPVHITWLHSPPLRSQEYNLQLQHPYNQNPEIHLTNLTKEKISSFTDIKGFSATYSNYPVTNLNKQNQFVRAGRGGKKEVPVILEVKGLYFRNFSMKPNDRLKGMLNWRWYSEGRNLQGVGIDVIGGMTWTRMKSEASKFSEAQWTARRLPPPRHFTPIAAVTIFGGSDAASGNVQFWGPPLLRSVSFDWLLGEVKRLAVAWTRSKMHHIRSNLGPFSGRKQFLFSIYNLNNSLKTCFLITC